MKKTKESRHLRQESEPQTFCIAAVTPYPITPRVGQRFPDKVTPASCHETESLTAGTIAPADLLPPEYRQ